MVIASVEDVRTKINNRYFPLCFNIRTCCAEIIDTHRLLFEGINLHLVSLRELQCKRRFATNSNVIGSIKAAMKWQFLVPAIFIDFLDHLKSTSCSQRSNIDVCLNCHSNAIRKYIYSWEQQNCVSEFLHFQELWHAKLDECVRMYALRCVLCAYLLLNIEISRWNAVDTNNAYIAFKQPKSNSFQSNSKRSVVQKIICIVLDQFAMLLRLLINALQNVLFASAAIDAC